MKIRFIIIGLIFITFVPSILNSQIEWDRVRTNSEYVQSIDCANGSLCAALAHKSFYRRLMYSTNAGLNWDVLYDDVNQPNKPFPLTSTNISYPVGDKIFIGSSDAHLIIHNLITNIHDTIIFVSQKHTGKINMPVWDIDMYNNLSGIAGFPAYVFITNDGWNSYRELIFDEEMIPEGFSVRNSNTPTKFVCSIDERNFFVSVIFHKKITEQFLETKSVIAKTSNFGDTWHLTTLFERKTMDEPYIFIKNIYFFDKSTGWIIATEDDNVEKDQKKSVLLKTIDGGESWQVIYEFMDSSSTFSNISFHNLDIGILVGSNGLILRTTDGGNSWINESPEDVSQKQNRVYQFITFLGENPLLATSNDGIFKGKLPLSVNSKEATELGIYPNPAYSFITLSHDMIQHYERYKIYDIKGRKLQSELLSSYRIDISGLEQGTYYLQLYNSSGLSVTSGFVKIGN
ncbi:MAG: T9SS type A sorting domain-containing protein [Candidatus Kapabacteria bacterium]|nr:T9SS type A sorting domain-containing protein [Ignavibacteriota bacterium]MCW5883827.1 T9SS type A sorting domain-containing protein [Candidatus Kapabacteria bacterium]